jgi:hypothetical protein
MVSRGATRSLLWLFALTAAVQGCTTASNCSLNGVCAASACVCDAPWTGAQCGHLAFAAASPAVGKDLANTAADLGHNTWNGPMVQDGPDFHMYVPLYPAGLLYDPVSVLHGTSPARDGPWTWANMSDVQVAFNPGALQYIDPTDGKMRFTYWSTKVNGETAGKVYTSASAAGPFVEIPFSNNTGCYINPSPFVVDGKFFCTGQKGTEIMTGVLGSPTPWTLYATMPAGHHGEDPFFWVDGRKNWHALFHSSAPSASGHGTHCASSGVASHLFSSDSGKTWDALNPIVQPYKPSVVWDDASTPRGYATMERPHLYFDGAPGTTTGRATHLSVAAPLNIGDEGCVNDVKGPKWPESKCKRAPCSCQLCKYVSHAGSLLIALA